MSRGTTTSRRATLSRRSRSKRSSAKPKGCVNIFIGVGRFELFIPEASSLKDKRHVLRSVTATVTRKFNVSIAEVDHQNLWQRAAVGVSCVSQTPGQCRKIMQEVEKAVGRSALDGADIVDRQIEVFALEDMRP